MVRRKVVVAAPPAGGYGSRGTCAGVMIGLSLRFAIEGGNPHGKPGIRHGHSK